MEEEARCHAMGNRSSRGNQKLLPQCALSPAPCLRPVTSQQFAYSFQGQCNWRATQVCLQMTAQAKKSVISDVVNTLFGSTPRDFEGIRTTRRVSGNTLGDGNDLTSGQGGTTPPLVINLKCCLNLFLRSTPPAMPTSNLRQFIVSAALRQDSRLPTMGIR